MLYSNFKRFAKVNELFYPGQKILLAISGGIDSVVMAYLFHRAGFTFGIAHCNFQLRGEDAVADEDFVKALAKRLEVPFYSEKFETKAYADLKGLSIQMAARELRYTWFQELLNEHHYHFIATAHHKDDLAETVLLNLVKGSVLTGLQGILPKNGNIIRPMLFAEKKDIAEYASHNKIKFREDKSNAENKYQRNIIRNEVIPLLEKINPDIAETIYHASLRRQQLVNWIEVNSEGTKQKIIRPCNSGVQVLISDLKSNEIPAEIFFKWVADYGFNYTQIEELFSNLDATETRLFESAIQDNEAQHFRMIKDRSFITIDKTAIESEAEILVSENTHSVLLNNIQFTFKFINPGSVDDFKLSNTAFLDAEKVIYPLLIRKWAVGDSFIPFGLKGSKLLSDYLTDLKMAHSEKENQLVVCSGNHICWVVGKRIDERFKVGHVAKKVLKITV